VFSEAYSEAFRGLHCPLFLVVKTAKDFFWEIGLMKNVMKKFWNDEAGFVVTVEMILVATVLVIGLVSGLTLLRDSVLEELSDTAQAFGAVDQSYSISSAKFDGTAGSSDMGFLDAPGVLDGVNEGEGLPVVTGLAVTVSGKYTPGGTSNENP